MAEHRPHDPIYRRIFNRAQIIEEILRRFVQAPWTAQLDYSTLEAVPTDFVSKRLKKRESDIIWRVRHGQGEDDWFYVFILMELQSRVEHVMALRLTGYLVELAEALIKDQTMLAARRPSRLLPPILPVVLYNGEAPWTAPRRLSALFQKMEGYRAPELEYVVLDVNRYAPEDLRPVQDMTSGVFLVEQSVTVEELTAIVDEIAPLVTDADFEEDLALLIGSIASKLGLANEEIPETRNFKEVRMSLLERAERWTQEWFAEGEKVGKKAGEKVGEKRGRRLGMAEVLKNLASIRFGELPAWAIEQIDRADIETLDRWNRQLLDAAKLEDVFDNSRA